MPYNPVIKLYGADFVFGGKAFKISAGVKAAFTDRAERNRYNTVFFFKIHKWNIGIADFRTAADVHLFSVHRQPAGHKLLVYRASDKVHLCDDCRKEDNNRCQHADNDRLRFMAPCLF